MIDRRWILGLLLSGCLSRAQALEPLQLEPLLDLLSAGGHRSTRYLETKTISLLEMPLKLRGYVEFRPPDYLAKHVLEPAEEHYIIDGDEVIVERPGETEIRFDLSVHPALEAFAASLRAPLAGDGASLTRFYRVSLGGTRNHWTLALVPRRPEMAGLVRLVTLEGRGDHLERLEIEESGGDRSSMVFTHEDPPATVGR